VRYNIRISRAKKVNRIKNTNHTALYKFGKIKAQTNNPIMPKSIEKEIIQV
jgi:hypothetical protein